MALNIYILQL